MAGSTPSPTSSTTPAKSQPNTTGHDFTRKPYSAILKSTGLVEACVTRTRTVPGVGRGRGISPTAISAKAFAPAFCSSTAFMSKKTEKKKIEIFLCNPTPRKFKHEKQPVDQHATEWSQRQRLCRTSPTLPLPRSWTRNKKKFSTL
eukprot:m.113384 g.113384  ORF g.113384 m.113384 type:complete len:146 (-) comp19310_c11_seq1:2509-2946(-)